jgi:hypothetical protein
MGELDTIIERLASMEPEEREALEGMALEETKDELWVPNPGPQQDAYDCEADELLYGGEPGGGKSDLIIGLSLTQHKRSLVLRRTNKEAEKLPDRYEQIIGHRKGYNSQRGTWRINGRIIDMGGCENEKDKQKRKGIPHDLKAFDELPDFTRTQYEFIINWTRSVDPRQRCRVVATANPPTDPSGIWVIERWAPWLDPGHPRPAKSGEIRWYLKLEDGEEIEVDDAGPYEVGGKVIRAKSRTFIRSRLADNPDLARTDYGSTLAAAGKEIRGLAQGDFESALQDVPNQVIPTQWIRLAMHRRREYPQHPAGVPMCTIGVDASGGGRDPMILAPRYDGWYADLIEIPGKDIPIERAGKFGAGLIMSYRRDKAVIVLDMGGGYGGAILEQLVENSIDTEMFKGAEKSVRRTEEGQYGFANKRTEAYWRFREALDPSRPGGSPIMLPEDLALLAELAAPTFKEDRKVIELEPKDQVVERLGRSPDRADAVVMAWTSGGRYITHGRVWEKEFQTRGPRGMQQATVMGRQNNRKRR